MILILSNLDKWRRVNCRILRTFMIIFFLDWLTRWARGLYGHFIILVISSFFYLLDFFCPSSFIRVIFFLLGTLVITTILLLCLQLRMSRLSLPNWRDTLQNFVAIIERVKGHLLLLAWAFLSELNDDGAIEDHQLLVLSQSLYMLYLDFFLYHFQWR